MADFDSKMNNISEEARKGRSKLAQQGRAMDKKLRAMVSNKVKTITAKTAAEFKETRQKMAEDRAHADAMVV